MVYSPRGVLVHSDNKTDHLDPMPFVNFKVNMNSMAMVVCNKYTRPIPVPSLLLFTCAQAPASRRKMPLTAAKEFEEVFLSLTAIAAGEHEVRLSSLSGPGQSPDAIKILAHFDLEIKSHSVNDGFNKYPRPPPSLSSLLPFLPVHLSLPLAQHFPLLRPGILREYFPVSKLATTKSIADRRSRERLYFSA